MFIHINMPPVKPELKKQIKTHTRSTVGAFFCVGHKTGQMEKPECTKLTISVKELIHFNPNSLEIDKRVDC